MDVQQHTPGPWKACRGANCPCGAIWDASGEIHLATAFDATALGMDCFGSDIGVSREERIANAALIAAAPDLLAALEATVGPLDILAAFHGWLDDQGVRAKVKAAIAKARLSQPPEHG